VLEVEERRRRWVRRLLLLGALVVLGAVVVFGYVQVLRAGSLAGDNARLTDERQGVLAERERAGQELERVHKELEERRLDDLGRRASELASSSEQGLIGLELGIRAVGAAPGEGAGARLAEPQRRATSSASEL
jgi:hypothetical protein